MLDIKFVRENKTLLEKVIKQKKAKANYKKIIAADDKRKKLLALDEELRMERNKISKLGKEGASANIKIKKELGRLVPELEKANRKFKELMFELPNIPARDVPVGASEEDNVVERKVTGAKPAVSEKEVKDHAELGKNLDIIDTESAGSVSGSRFSYLKNQAVLMQFAIINWIMEIMQKEKFIPIIPPVIENFEVARKTGYFETLSDDAYHIKQDPMVLVGTSEQSILPYHMNTVFNEKDLPKRYLGYSTCFRREAGSYGKDVAGIFRSHQFDKLEMVEFCKPEDSEHEHKYLLDLEEKIMKELKIPYQVVKMCTGDLGLPAVRKFDIEAWIPSQKKYRETHSVSSCTDFQARRLNIKYRTPDGKTEFVHTLNGTAVAIGRIMVAIMENYQQPDGTILVPKVLQKYTVFKKITK